jgi:hypothetical protein
MRLRGTQPEGVKMTTITVQDRLTAAQLSSEWRYSQNANTRRLGELLLLATQIEAFEHNYSIPAIVKANSAIKHASLGTTKLMVNALEALGYMSHSSRLDREKV